jgi:hypothetical protein
MSWPATMSMKFIARSYGRGDVLIARRSRRSEQDPNLYSSGYANCAHDKAQHSPFVVLT